MNDAASFDAILQCNLLEVFCEALGAAIFVTDKFDEISFASIRLPHLFPIRESAIAAGGRARDLYGALYDAGLRFAGEERSVSPSREEWIAERIAYAWKERVDKIEQVGPERWIHIVSRRFSSGLGLVVIQDVSEQKKKESQLRSEQERVRLTEEILDSLPLPVAVKDRNLDYVAVNQEFCRLVGRPSEAILGRGIWQALSPELAGRIEQMDWHLLSSGEPSRAQVTHVRPDGQTFELERRARRLGKPGSHYIALTLSERVAYETPGGEALAPFEVAAEPRPEPQGAPPSSAPAMLRNVLVLTDIKRHDQALKLALHAHGADVCYIRDVPEFAAFLPAALVAGIKIDLVMIDFEFDAAAFNIAAANKLNFRMLPAGADESTVLVEILNSLALPRQMIEPPPIEPPSLPVEDALGTEAVSGGMARIDVLGVEDNPVNRLVLEQILSGLGVSFHIAGSAAEGLDDYGRFSPRIVLTDMTLPDLPAADFAVRIRHLDPAATLVALLTGDTEDHRHHAEMAGFGHSLSKPLNAEVLGTLLPDLLASRK